MSDERTAAAFASSWNRIGSVYSAEQFLDWIAPLHPEDFRDRTVLELGFGNGSLLVHTAALHPRRLTGVELGDTIERTRRNLSAVEHGSVELLRGDLTKIDAGEHDVVYCIGVLHHLEEPGAGFDAVLRHTRPGGRFHCWVYAHEGNAAVRRIVDPMRRIASRLPWWLTKYAIALPLAVVLFAWAKTLARAPRLARRMPLGEYMLWIARERFAFFHHVVFDQLVTPRTSYLRRSEIEAWLRDPRVVPSSTYVIFRNGNSWKFGGERTST